MANLYSKKLGFRVSPTSLNEIQVVDWIAIGAGLSVDAFIASYTGRTVILHSITQILKNLGALHDPNSRITVTRS